MSKNIQIGYGTVKKVQVGGLNPLAFVGGPCAIENKDHALFMAESISKVCKKVRVRKRGEERKTSFLTMPSNLELTSYVESPSASRTNSSA